MSLDAFSSGISSRQSHPKGEFVGMVDSVKKEISKNSGKSFIVVRIKTPKGYAPDFRLNYVSEDDYKKAKYLSDNGDEKDLGKIVTSISMTKNFIVKMGLVHKDMVDSMGYSACLKELPKLVGMKVKVSVVAQKNNPDFDASVLSKMDEEVNKSEPSNGFSIDDVPF